MHPNLPELPLLPELRPPHPELPLRPGPRPPHPELPLRPGLRTTPKLLFNPSLQFLTRKLPII